MLRTCELVVVQAQARELRQLAHRVRDRAREPLLLGLNRRPTTPSSNEGVLPGADGVVARWIDAPENVLSISHMRP